MASALRVAFRTLFTCLFIFMFGFCAKNKFFFFFFDLEIPIRVIQCHRNWYHATDWLWFGFLSVLPITFDKQSNGRPVAVYASPRLDRDVELIL